MDEDEIIAMALLIMDGQRVRVPALVDRFGSRPARYGEGTEITVHLRDVIDASTGELLRSTSGSSPASGARRLPSAW